jgi:RNA polymerase sigma factor (sigma-70 family)
MSAPTGSPVHRLRQYLAVHDLDAQPDSILLGRFAADRDEAAFTALVRRHTPLVLGTARRILGRPADAEDVLQAVFLTLARKAPAIHCRGTLAPWLYRVTCRAAGRVRRRSRPVQPLTDHAAEIDPLAQMSARELCSAIDTEVARLSSRLRAPVVLCCLQGLTRDEAAAHLGWSSATLKRRLARARELLDRRLRARGVTLPAALAPVLLAVRPPAAEAVSEAVQVALGRAAPPARVGALCGVPSIGKSWLVGALACGVAGLGLAFGLRDRPGPGPEPPTTDNDSRPTGAAAAVDAHGDPLPTGAVARIGTTRFRHDQWVNLATWSPDGKYIASAAGETLIVWDAKTGREFSRIEFDKLPPPPGDAPGRDSKFIRNLEWSRDGRTVFATVHGLARRCAWDASSKQLSFVQNYVGDEEILVMGLSADGSRTFAATRNSASSTHWDSGHIWSFERPVGSMITDALLSPAEELAVISTSGETGQLHVFDLRFRQPVIKTIGRTVNRVTFSADGRWFAAAACGEPDVELEVWDATTWRNRIRIPYTPAGDRPGEIRALALSPDGKTLVTGSSDKTLRWWDTATGKETRRVGPGWVYYNRAAFRPDGKVLMTVSHENHVRLWDVATGKELPVGNGPGWLMAAVAPTPDGRRVLSVSEHTVYTHDAATGRELWHAAEHTDTAVQVVVTPDGRTAISSGNEGLIIFWELETGKVVRRVETPRHAVDLLALSPDGRTLAALGNEDHDRTVRRWDLVTGKAYPDVTLPAKDAKYVARSIRYTPDGRGLVIPSATETQVLVFDLDRKEIAGSYSGADGGLNWADVTADGRTVAASTAGGSIYLWETTTAKPRVVLKNVGYTTCLAFSPDGRILAVVNDASHRLTTTEKTIGHAESRTVVRLLDSFTGQEIHRFAGHTGSVYRLAWLGNDRLLSASHDSSGLIWDVSSAIRAKLPAAPLSENEAETAAAALGGLDTPAVYKEMGRLVSSPATAVATIGNHLHPVPSADATVVADLLRDLDSSQFAVRERAAARLSKFGDAIEEAFRRALDSKPSAEVRDRIERLLADLTPSSERLRQGRALEILERIGTPEARRLLRELAGGAQGAWLTREAAASLARVTPPAR